VNALTTRFTLGEHVRDVVVDGQTVILDLQRGVYLGLDDVATRIWQRVRGGQTGETIADVLAAEYQVPVETTREDVDRFLSDLRLRRLIDAPAEAAVAGGWHRLVIAKVWPGGYANKPAR
jgi:hypothetical protein